MQVSAHNFQLRLSFAPSMSLTIRLRLPSGPAQISLAPESTLSELLAHISEKADAEAEALTVSHGFPPRPLALEADAPISGVLQPMDLLTVAVAAAAAPAPAAKKGRGRGAAGRGANAGRSSPAVGRGAASGNSSVGVVHTLSNPSGSGGGGGSARKRPAAASGGGGGGGKRGKALQLGSEEGIGASLLGAVSRKGGGAHHKEDPAQSFLKAAAQSALAHHVEEVHANERFQVRDTEVTRSLGFCCALGKPCACDVRSCRMRRRRSASPAARALSPRAARAAASTVKPRIVRSPSRYVPPPLPLLSFLFAIFNT